MVEKDMIEELVTSGHVIVFANSTDGLNTEMIVVKGDVAAMVISLIAHARAAQSAEKCYEIAEEMHDIFGAPETLEDALKIAKKVSERMTEEEA